MLPEAHPPFPKELVGWKTIATYLRVSVRTAQDFEKVRGLPVRRGSGIKAPVFALRAELEEWSRNEERIAIQSPGKKDSGLAFTSNLARVESSLPAPDAVAVSPSVPATGLASPGSPIDVTVPPPSGGTSAGENTFTPDRVDRRRWLRSVALGTAALGIAGTGIALGARWLFGPAPVPTAYRIEGATLIVLGKDDKEIWRYEFASGLDEAFYSATTGRSCAFADLDGDGRIETLFNCCLESKSPEQYLTCFDNKGKLLWNFHPSGTVADSAGREFLPPFSVNDFEVVQPAKGHQSKIVAACNHHFSFPAQVVMLDCHGRLLSRYWHRGHLTHIVVADLDGSGEPTVLLGGVNDALEYKRATLLAIDHRSFSGGSVSPSGSPYFASVGPGTEKVEVFFPKTRVSERKEFNRVNYVGLRQNRILVCITEDIGEPGPWRVDYELDLNFNVTAVAFTDTLYTKYAEIFGDSRRAGEAVRRDEEWCNLGYAHEEHPAR
jgi:hypothetical protein